jgi:hypothetical protein
MLFADVLGQKRGRHESDTSLRQRWPDFKTKRRHHGSIRSVAVERLDPKPLR